MNNANYIRRKTDNIGRDNHNLNDDNFEMVSNEDYQQNYNDTQMRRHSDSSGINENTLINLDKGQPVGLDFKKFLSEAVPDMTVHSISQSNDLPIISQVNEEHQSFKGVVSKRLNCMKMIANCWAGSNYSSAFNAINLMKDSSVCNDFFYYCFIKNDITNVPLTMDNVITLLPHVVTLINSKYDNYVKNGVRTAWNLLKYFNDRIISLKNVVLTNGVDFAREERLKKCDSIIELYEKISLAPNLTRIISKQSGDDLFKITTSFISELDFFLKQCKKT